MVCILLSQHTHSSVLTNTDLDRQLFDTANSGDLTTIRHLLNGEPRPRTDSRPNRDRERALHVASGHGYLETEHFLVQEAAKQSIDRKVYLDLCDISGETALHKAAQGSSRNLAREGTKYNYSKVVKYLIKRGADTALEDHQKTTPWDICQTEFDELQLRPWCLPSVGVFALEEMNDSTRFSKWLYQDGEQKSLEGLQSSSGTWKWLYVAGNVVRISCATQRHGEADAAFRDCVYM